MEFYAFDHVDSKYCFLLMVLHRGKRNCQWHNYKLGFKILGLLPSNRILLLSLIGMCFNLLLNQIILLVCRKERHCPEIKLVQVILPHVRH